MGTLQEYCVNISGMVREHAEYWEYGGNITGILKDMHIYYGNIEETCWNIVKTLPEYCGNNTGILTNMWEYFDNIARILREHVGLLWEYCRISEGTCWDIIGSLQEY